MTGKKYQFPIEEEVWKARKHEEWRTEYMTFEMLQREKYKEGKCEERMEAIRRMKERGFNFKMIMKAGYTKAEYKQALRTEKIN